MTTERGAMRGAARRLRLKAFSLGLAALVWSAVAPRPVAAMTADGALITNTASASWYFGIGSVLSWGATTTGNLGGNSPALAAAGGFSVSYVASANVLVNCPVIGIQKIGAPFSQAPGGTVSFTLCVVNTGSTSAFRLSITDRLPDNMETANPPAYASWGGGTWTSSYSSDNVGYANGIPGNGQNAPYYLRWVVDPLGPQKSACVTYYTVIQ